MANILVVDDELGIRDLLWEILNDEGHTVEVAENAAQARAARLRERPDLVLLDIWMPDTDGVTLLKEWSSTGALTMPVIMMSGHATIDTAVEATKIGALAFLENPLPCKNCLKRLSRGWRGVQFAGWQLLWRRHRFCKWGELLQRLDNQVRRRSKLSLNLNNTSCSINPCASRATSSRRRTLSTILPRKMDP